jgi:uncharacterized protein
VTVFNNVPTSVLNREDLKEKIIATFKPFHPEKIILFGSRARGEDDAFSDVDVIVVYDTDKRFLERLKELYLSWNIGKAVDILAYTPEEFKSMMKKRFFIQKAVAEGEVLYERG